MIYLSKCMYFDKIKDIKVSLRLHKLVINIDALKDHKQIIHIVLLYDMSIKNKTS